MKFFAVIASIIVSVVAEPPAGPIFIARYPAAPQQAPLLQYQVQANRQQPYVLARLEVPQTSYNPAQEATTEGAERNSTDDSVENSTEALSEQIQTQNDNKEQRNQNGKLVEGANPVPLEQGVYYLYHPTGALQRVAYSTSNDAANMAYVAQLKYQNVNPIRDPIYTYDPDTFFLQQVRV